MKKLLSIIYVSLLILLSACSVQPTQTPMPADNTQVVPTEMPASPQTTSPSPDYPRLGMWWPDSSTQPLNQIARYDWVILGEWQKDVIPALRQLNPQILLLNSTNACELSFNPEDAEENALIREIPYQWFLTQVGSTISADIDAGQTTVPVEAVTVQDAEGKTIALFQAGDAVLIEGESMLVKRVDASRKILTVERGYVRPASAHAKGTRIAAHISFWPNSWLLNVSTLSPAAIYDPQIGAERWTDFNARRGEDLLTDADWDGLLIDRSDPNESWLIGNSTARSIDPDQSNHLLSDYSAFDAAWNDGLRSYLGKLREAAGEQKILYLNWGIADYTDVNGDNFEGFPDLENDYRNWHAQIFGPAESGSYLEWMEKARTPNLTMVETYEDNSGPAPEDTDGYDNRCAEANFTPNYQKMRFGLTTSLLMNGYFSYEMNTEGHGSLCLMWFDEYDNAGAGRGYLGQPLGDAYPVNKLATPNLLENKEWSSWADPGYALNASDEAESSVRLEVSQSAGVDWMASYSAAPIEIRDGEAYTLTFQARSDQDRKITVWVQQDQEPWKTYLWFGEVNLTPDWQTFVFPLKADGSDPSARLYFGLGSQMGNVWLKDWSLQTGNNDIYRRDFEKGIVLVNATDESTTISLGGEYQKINGRQDRSVNDGSIVSQVTLSAHDGIILLRTSEHN